MKGLELKNVGLSGTKPVWEHSVVIVTTLQHKHNAAVPHVEHLLLFTCVLLVFDWCATKGAVLGIEVGAVNMIAVVLESNIQVILTSVMMLQ